MASHSFLVCNANAQTTKVISCVGWLVNIIIFELASVPRLLVFILMYAKVVNWPVFPCAHTPSLPLSSFFTRAAKKKKSEKFYSICRQLETENEPQSFICCLRARVLCVVLCLCVALHCVRRDRVPSERKKLCVLLHNNFYEFVFFSACNSSFTSRSCMTRSHYHHYVSEMTLNDVCCVCVMSTSIWIFSRAF